MYYIFGKKKKTAKQITVDFGSKCWLNVLQYAVIGKNVLFLEKCFVFGEICAVFRRNVLFLEKCADSG